MTPKAASGSTIFQGVLMLLLLALLARSETVNTENILAGVNQDGNDVFPKSLSNQAEDSNAQYFASTTEKISEFVEFNGTLDDSNLTEINNDDKREPTTPKSIKDDGKKSLKDDTNVNYNGNSQTASPDEFITISQKNSNLKEKPNLIPEDNVDKLKIFKYNSEQVLGQSNGVVEGGDNNNNKTLENIEPVTEAIKIETITAKIIETELSNGSLLPKARNIPPSKLNNFNTNTGEKVIDTTKESSTSGLTKEIIPDNKSSTSNSTTFNHSTTNQPKDTDNIINQYDQKATEPSINQNLADHFIPLPKKRSDSKVNLTLLGSTPTYNEIPKNFDGKEMEIIVDNNRTDGNSSVETGNEPTVLPNITTTTTKTTEPLSILAEILTTNSPKDFETTTTISISSSPDESTNLDTSETTTPEIMKTTLEIKPEIETTTLTTTTTTTTTEITTPEIKIESYNFTDSPITTEILPNLSTNTTSESITSPTTQEIIITTENIPETTTEIPTTENLSTIDDVIPKTTLQTTPLPEEPTTITEFTSQENSEILKTVSSNSNPGEEEGRGIYSTQEMNFTTTPTTLIIPDVENKTSNLNTSSTENISSTTIPSILPEQTKTSYFPNTTLSVSTEITTTTTTIQIDVYPRSGQNVDVVVRIVVEANWTEVCKNLPDLQKSLADLLGASLNKSVGANQIIFQTDGCKDNIPDPVVTLYFYVINKNGEFDSKMTEILPALYSQSSVKTNLTITSVELIQNTDSGNAIAVVVVCCVAFTCLVLLAGLLFIMRKRQTRFNYGERCRPVSLDAYSLDSVSAYNSVRRKGAMRSSKRSYGNPTFEDSTAIPSHPLNFSVLSKFCHEESKIYEEYSNIPQVTAKIDELPPGAEIKNRYANVIPLPETRVPLAKINNDTLSEYINASYVRGPKNATKYYIACQAPIESTVADFWRMIWEQQTKVIIMLTELVENDIEKCAEYIPPSEVTDCRRLYGDFQVTLKKRETKEKYAISTLYLKNLEDNSYREISHIWYLWPTSGIQTDAVGMIAVLLEARALQRGGPGPIVVHCSPGTGRTGTLIALDLGIRQYEITRTVDVPRVVYTIRRDRAGAVQTKEQYAFIYKALNLYATKLAGGGLEST